MPASTQWAGKLTQRLFRVLILPRHRTNFHRGVNTVANECRQDSDWGERGFPVPSSALPALCEGDEDAQKV